MKIKSLLSALLSAAALTFSLAGSANADSLIIDDFSQIGAVMMGSNAYSSSFISTSTDGMTYDCCRTRFSDFDHSVANVFGGTREITMRNSVSQSGGNGALLLDVLPSAETLTAVVGAQRFNQNSAFMFMNYSSASTVSLGNNAVLVFDFAQVTTTKADDLLNLSVYAKGADGLGHSFTLNLSEGNNFSSTIALDDVSTLKSLNISFGGGGPNAGTSSIDLQKIVLDKISVSYFAPSPVPEPETYALMLAGLGLIGVIARRKRLVA